MIILYQDEVIRVQSREMGIRISQLTGNQCIYLTFEQLADIGEAVAKYLEREAEYEYEEFAWPYPREV